jgi:membrane-bound metal-dependent hydrolase YbcI (DUF457 family)
MLTHVVFGAGAAAVLTPFMPDIFRLYIAVTLSLLVNPVIDGLGHFRRGPHVARSPLTHSVFTAPLWGAAVGYLLWAGWRSLVGPAQGLMEAMVVSGVVVALSHLLLDAMTERGVYLLGGRVALAHLRSGNGMLNALFLLVGVGLCLAQLQV